MTRIWGWFLATLACLMLTLGGLFWDAMLHSHEVEHLVEESLLDLSNPGHAVFGLGLVLTTLIALTGFTASWLPERRRASGWQSLAMPALLWLLMGIAGAITLTALAQT